MVSFNITKSQDKYYLLNTEETTITYELQKITDCVYFETISTGSIAASEEIEIVLTGDGEYQIILTNDEEGESTVLIRDYNELLVSTIASIYDVLCQCGCGCSGCSELETNECHALLLTKAKMDAFKRLVNPQYVSYLDAVYSETKCLISKQIYCCITEENIKGSATFNEKLIKQLIALDYLAIYFHELNSASTDEDIAYVKSKFKTNKIFCCISSLGIDIQEIEQLINDNMGTLTINSGAYVNLPPDNVGDNTIAVANRAVTILTLAMFTTGTTPAYSDPEGDPVDALRVDTLPADGVLYLNGIAVTLGQVIDAADISSNLFTYESPDQDAIDTDSFNFSLRDTGSLMWSS